MSLVDALQVSPARSRRKKIGSLGISSPKMSGGVRVEVTLLDGRKLEFSVGARLLTQELMSLVTSHFALRESQYFALAYRDNTGHYHWLLNDRRLLDHDFARGVRHLPLHFLVRFFPESVSELKDAQTVELFYQHAKNIIAKGQIEVENSTALQLATFSLHASIGDFIDETTSKNYFKKSLHVHFTDPKDHSQRNICEEQVCKEHQQLIGRSRGDAILSYMRQVECTPAYGVHFYEVRDRSNLPWHLGISQRGIAQYDYLDRRKPIRVFFWKQLENLYFRERKFSIEVHDPKRVVLALNSFNLYEGAIEDSFHLQDELLQAITEDTTQVSVSRRTFGPGNVSVYVWFAESQSLCKSIWSMAIAQHQFYLDRKTSRSKEGVLKGLQDTHDIAGDLSRSCLSLSTHSSSPNLSRSGSHSSLQHNSHTEDSASTESLHAARMEILALLQQRYETLQEKLEEKTEELKLLCLREGELTGELPPEYPRKPGEAIPVVRKRVGTSFILDEALINKIINKQEETVSSLELEYEIQVKIASAALRIAHECSKKGLRKQRKHSYHQAAQRLRDVEQRLRLAKNRQAQVIANNASTMPKMKKKPRPVSDGEGVQDDSCIGLGSVNLSPQDCLKETSFIDGIPLSPSGNVSPGSPMLQAHMKNKAPPPVTLHSAPPSPQRGSSGHGTPSESSGQHSLSKSSRSNSPNRPTSGYIPSCVYTRSQYRAQHYPTLSTRGQSVPAENLQHQRSFNGGLYNLPQQRTSLASHSLDDLESSNSSNSPVSSSVKNPPPPPPPINQLPPHPHHINYQYTPHHQHFKHHQHQSHHHVRRQRNESHDRFGSLDRRRATSGRFESRSMEHLDSLPQYIASPSPSPVQHPTTVAVNSPHPSSYYPSHFHNDYPFTAEPVEGQTYPFVHHSTSYNYDNTPVDVVDGVRNVNSAAVYSANLGIEQSPGIGEGHFIPKEHAAKSERDQSNIRHPNQRLMRSSSGRSYTITMETNFPGTPSNHGKAIETHFIGETQSYPSNQENIPPMTGQPSAEVLLPLRVSCQNQRAFTRKEGHSTNLRPTASVNAADHLRPYRIPATDLPPLRPTKSSSELPPLKPTNGRNDSSSSHSNYYQGTHRNIRNDCLKQENENIYVNKNVECTPKNLNTTNDYMKNNSHVDSSFSGQQMMNGSLSNEEPLLSLAEGARLKKEQREREWYESGADTPKSGSDSSRNQRILDFKTPSTPHSLHNLSTSSIGSSGSSSSVFQSTNEGSDSLNSTLNSSSINSSLNATLTVISTGSYQPSREVSKPFEMADFYKYSTKFRRKSSTGGQSCRENGTPEPSHNSGMESPLSPALPPRSQMMLDSTSSLISHQPPPSPSLVAQHSSPAPQQKGTYQPLLPHTCKPLEEGSDPLGDHHHLTQPKKGSWEHSPIHQAVPVNVTTKRSATLV